MPSGWIGSGSNGWIYDDAFDNQAVINEEQGRVLLDSKQEMKRTKQVNAEIAPAQTLVRRV